MGKKESVAKDVLSAIYKNYKNSPIENWNPKKTAAILKDFEMLNGADGNTKTQLRDFVLIAARVAHNCTEKDFVDSIMAGELPAVKLTKSEMATLKGGAGVMGWLSTEQNQLTASLGSIAAGSTSLGVGGAMLAGNGLSSLNLGWGTPSAMFNPTVATTLAVGGALALGVGVGLMAGHAIESVTGIGEKAGRTWPNFFGSK